MDERSWAAPDREMIKGILKKTRRRTRHENTEEKREREREKRIELAKTNSLEAEAGARGKLAVSKREK